MIGPRVRAGLVLLFVFGAGMLAGIALERHRVLPAPRAASQSSPLAPEHEATIAELARELDLDRPQVEQIHRLLIERQKVIQRHWEQLRPEVHAAMQDVHREIAELLRPEQAAAYHRWLLERRRQGLPH